MTPLLPRARQPKIVPGPILPPGNVIELIVGVLFVIAPGTGPLGPLQDALGAANAAPAPRVQIVPAAAAAMANFVIERLNIKTSLFCVIGGLPLRHSAEAPQVCDWLAELETGIRTDF